MVESPEVFGYVNGIKRQARIDEDLPVGLGDLDPITQHLYERIFLAASLTPEGKVQFKTGVGRTGVVTLSPDAAGDDPKILGRRLRQYLDRGDGIVDADDIYAGLETIETEARRSYGIVARR